MRVATLGYALCFTLVACAYEPVETGAPFLDTCDISDLRTIPLFQNCIKLFVLLDLAREIRDPDDIWRELWYVSLMISKEVQVFIESGYNLPVENELAIAGFLEHLYTLYTQGFAGYSSDYAVALEKILFHNLELFTSTMKYRTLCALPQEPS